MISEISFRSATTVGKLILATDLGGISIVAIRSMIGHAIVATFSKRASSLNSTLMAIEGTSNIDAA